MDFCRIIILKPSSHMTYIAHLKLHRNLLFITTHARLRFSGCMRYTQERVELGLIRELRHSGRGNMQGFRKFRTAQKMSQSEWTKSFFGVTSFTNESLVKKKFNSSSGNFYDSKEFQGNLIILRIDVKLS